MKSEDFLAFLEEHGVRYKQTEKSIILSESPCCGGFDKIYLFNESDDGQPLFGKCMKCDTSWSSWSYLYEMGIEHQLVARLHDAPSLDDFHLKVLPALSIDLAGKKTNKTPEKAPVFDIFEFEKVTAKPEHPAAKYAVKRGWTHHQEDSILIDIMSNAVVFVCRENGSVVGYQKRFLKPANPKMKTKSAAGFKKTQYVLEFPSKGDILICEGPFTALAAWHYGYHGICTFGAAVSERQLEIISLKAAESGKKVGVSFDMDKAGRKGYRRVRLAMLWKNIETFRVIPETGNDLNDSWMAKKGIVIIPPDQDDVTIPDLELNEMGN